MIFEAVSHARTHPTAEEVLLLARKKLPAISLATVYRNLHLLAEEGKIREVQFQGDAQRYDGMTEAHEHFYCMACRRAQDLPARMPKTIVKAVERATLGEISDYSLNYYGLCGECRAARTRDAQTHQG